MHDTKSSMRYNDPLIRWRMDKLGLTCESLSRLAGISAPTTKRVVYGESVKVDTLLAVADALNLKREFLLREGFPFRRAVERAVR